MPNFINHSFCPQWRTSRHYTVLDARQCNAAWLTRDNSLVDQAAR
jgi:hypothetical protein